MSSPSFPRLVGRCGLLAVFASWALGACDDGGGGIDSGVTGTKELGELTSDEAEKICDAAQEFGKAVLSERAYARFACATLALQEGDVEACRDTQAACEKGQLDGGADLVGAPLFGLQRQAPACFEASDFSGCDATVAALESCYEALIAQRQRQLYLPRCESLAASGAPMIDEPPPPPVCATFEAKCPGLGPLLTNAPVVIEPPDGVDAGIDPIDPIDPPPPPSATCEDLALGYDGSDCASQGCGTPVECDCDPFTQSFTSCNPVLGCIASLDCGAACDAGLGTVYSCADDLSCESDTDCGGYYCVDDGFGGECSRGEPGESCVDGGDCASGSCASSSGSMRCVGDASDGSACASDLECSSGICYIDFSVSSTDGTCSSGESGVPCSSDDECVDQSCVYGADGGECSDGSDQAPCSDDADCDSGLCAYGGRAYASCGNGELGAPCDSSGDCTSQVCETSSTTGESSCGYAIGDTCPGGVIDCDSACRPTQGDCGSALCAPSCGGGSCSGETLATWNMADVSGSLTVSGSDLTTSTSGLGDRVRATLGKTSGAYYWEVSVDALSVYDSGGVGVTSMAAVLADGNLGSSSVPGVVFGPSGTIANSAGDTLMGCGYAAGDVIGVALDLDAEVIYFSVNGLWQAGGSPDDGQGGIDLDLTAETVHPALELWSGDVYSANFGQTTFAFPPPAGFEPLY